jgi:hypothetical protein
MAMAHSVPARVLPFAPRFSLAAHHFSKQNMDWSTPIKLLRSMPKRYSSQKQLFPAWK